MLRCVHTWRLEEIRIANFNLDLKVVANSTVWSFELPSTIITSKSLKVCPDRSESNLGRYLASFKVGIMIEKKGLFINLLYNEFMITREQVYEQLKTVMDPELHVDIVSLGLIYSVTVEKCHVKIVMTLTTPGCPLAPEIDRLVREAIKPLGDCVVEIELVWEPAWSKDKMSEEARLTLGMI